MTISTATTTEVTEEQIARCHRFVDESTKLPFYLVQSERDELVEYKVATIRKNGQWYITCTCPAGLRGVPCKHRRWAAAAAAEYKEMIKAAAQAQARIDAENARQALYTKLHIDYASANVSNDDLALIAKRNETPASTSRGCIQARPFSIL